MLFKFRILVYRKRKKELIEEYKKNEEKLLAIYDVNKIFEKKKENVTEKREENTMIQIKENLFTKIIKKFKKILSQ